MGKSSIKDTVVFQLWGKAAGRCEYRGCNKELWIDSVTKYEFNSAYIAHIIAEKPDGPRGDPAVSKLLCGDISNLMLLCDFHHRLIDKGEVNVHTVEILREMKKEHEERIRGVTQIDVDRQCHVLLYGAKIGENDPPISYSKAKNAMLPDFYPASDTPLLLGITNSIIDDSSEEYWSYESKHLIKKYTEDVKPRINKEIERIAVFAVAPIPLLIQLGVLLSDLTETHVFQLHREPDDWKWQDSAGCIEYEIHEPEEIFSVPAINVSLSATVQNNRIHEVLGNDVSIWTLTIPNPNNDFLKSKEQVSNFRQTVRLLFNNIKQKYKTRVPINVFPAMPVALAVEFGRAIMPKADFPFVVYDENKKQIGFIKTIEINS